MGKKLNFCQLKHSLTFVSPNPFRSTFAELRMDGVTLVCKRRTPLLFAMSTFGNSVACDKKCNHLVVCCIFGYDTGRTPSSVCVFCAYLLEKRYVRTQASNIFVDLQQEFVIFEKCTPSTFRPIAKRMIGTLIVIVAAWWNGHFICPEKRHAKKKTNVEYLATRMHIVCVGDNNIIYLSIVCTVLVSSSTNYSNQLASDLNSRTTVSNIMTGIRLCRVCLTNKNKQHGISSTRDKPHKNTHNFHSSLTVET